MTAQVNIFDLAAAALASTISASIPIRNIASSYSDDNSTGTPSNNSQDQNEVHQPFQQTKELLSNSENILLGSSGSPEVSVSSSSPTAVDGISRSSPNEKYKMNTRKKKDGTLVTDADGAAQQIIVDSLRAISKDICIVGEESKEDERGDASDNLIRNENGQYNHKLDCTYEEILNTARKEIQLRRNFMEENNKEKKIESAQHEKVECARVSVYIDPLDGTKNFAKGKYDAVTTLVAIVVDNTPVFGVICKPFGKKGEPSLNNSRCFAGYGGILLNGAFVAGGGHCTIFQSPQPTTKDSTSESPLEQVTKRSLPRAVISRSRAGGLVGECLNACHNIGILDKDPVFVDGAGEKSLRLINGTLNETLWFFPHPGTSLWDVAALDAILLSVGGKLTDKNGQRLDYTKKCRLNASNLNGIIASNDANVYDECMRIYRDIVKDNGN